MTIPTKLPPIHAHKKYSLPIHIYLFLTWETKVFFPGFRPLVLLHLLNFTLIMLAWVLCPSNHSLVSFAHLQEKYLPYLVAPQVLQGCVWWQCWLTILFWLGDIKGRLIQVNEFKIPFHSVSVCLLQHYVHKKGLEPSKTCMVDELNQLVTVAYTHMYGL